MADYIDRQELQDMLQNRICGIDDDKGILLVEKGGIWVNALDELPTADVVPVVHGRWISGKEIREYKCSNCEFCFWHKTNYCPECGAKMNEVSE